MDVFMMYRAFVGLGRRLRGLTGGYKKVCIASYLKAARTTRNGIARRGRGDGQREALRRAWRRHV